MDATTILVSAPMAIDLPEPYVSHLRGRGFEVVMHAPEGQNLSETDLLNHGPNLVGVLCGDDQITRRVIDANPGLKAICKWGVGIDSIDWAYCADKGIAVRIVSGVHSQAMSEAACGLTLALYKRLFVVDRMVREGRWEKVESTTFEGSTIGLVGLGNIGRRAARMMSGWPVNLIGFDPDAEAMPDFSGRRVGRDEVFSTADCLVVMAPPATERSRIHEDGSEPELDKTLHLIKPGTLLVNVSRGALTPAAALEEGLEKGIIAAAGLDVYEIEPLPEDSRLRTEFADRVIFGAHTAYNCPGIKEKVTRLAFENLLEELQCPMPS